MKSMITNEEAMKIEIFASTLYYDLETGLPNKSNKKRFKNSLISQPICHDEYFLTNKKQTQQSIKTILKEAIKERHLKKMLAVFKFIIEHNYTAKKIKNLCLHVYQEDIYLANKLYNWTKQYCNKKDNKFNNNALVILICSHLYNKQPLQAIAAIKQLSKKTKHPSFQIQETIKTIEIEVWINLLNQQYKNNQTTKNLLSQIDKLRTKNIWSRKLATFAIPISAQYLREQAIKQIKRSYFLDAIKLLDQAISLNTNQSKNLSLYDQCISELLHHLKKNNQLTPKLTNLLLNKYKALIKKFPTLPESKSLKKNYHILKKSS